MTLRKLEAGLEVALVGGQGGGQRIGAARTRCSTVGGDPAAEGVDAGVGEGLAGHRCVGLLGNIELAAFEQQLDVVEARRLVGRVDGDGLLQLGQRRFGVAFSDQGLGFVDFGLGFQLVGRGHMLVEKGPHLGFGQGADEAVDRLAAQKQHAKRDRTDTEGLA